MAKVVGFSATVAAMVPTQDFGRIELALTETVEAEQDDTPEALAALESSTLDALKARLSSIIGVMSAPGATVWLKAISPYQPNAAASSAGSSGKRMMTRKGK